MAPFTALPVLRTSAERRAARCGQERFEVVVYDQESAATSRLASLPLTRRVDGVIVMSLPFDDNVATRLTEQRLPTVLIEIERPGFSSVTIDDAAGGNMVAELLMRRGHERLGFLGHAETTREST
jgi:DNA-binding LacI/PurR family transcriptional regulator